MKINRNTQVVSVSLPTKVVDKLEKVRKLRGQSRSAFVASLIEKQREEERWQKIYKLGAATAKKFKITSEDDIDKLLHEA